MSPWSLSVGIACVLVFGRLDAQPVKVDRWDSGARLERIEGSLRADLDAELAAYDAEIESRPFDVGLHVERCRLLDGFGYKFEYVEWLDEVFLRAEECRITLEDRFPEHPEIKLLELEGLFDDNALLRQARAILETGTYGWSRGQLSRLHELMALAAERLGNADAGEHALAALDLDRKADVRLQAADHLLAVGENERALNMLTSSFDGHGPDDYWYQLRKLQMLGSLGAKEAVSELYAGLAASTEYYDSLVVARALNDAGAIELARQEYSNAVKAQAYAGEAEHERFRFEYAHGTSSQVLSAYNALRDLGWQSDPLAINRATLFYLDPSLPLRPRDLLGLLALAATFGAIAIAVSVPIGLVHYRGHVRRRRLIETYPRHGWQLRHAWLATTAFLFASVLSYYFVGAPLGSDLSGDTLLGFEASEAQISNIFLAETLLGLALLVPLARFAAWRQPRWWGDSWSIGKSVGVGVMLGALFRVPLLLMAPLRPELSALLEEQLLVQIMLAVRDSYGAFAVFWAIGIAAPVVEEFLFRGVILRAFANHISFGWANVSQAAIFSGLHMDLAAAPILFMIGLVAGVITRRSGGLLAAMALHAAFNLIGGAVFLS